MEESCCTCARLLSQVTPIYDEKTEKPVAVDRRPVCCNRTICGNCIYVNPRFATYCPFCQISTVPTSLPQGLHEPPSYSTNFPDSGSSGHPVEDQLPSYDSLTNIRKPSPEKQTQETPADDVLHFLDHEHDTVASLSFRYGVPITAIRKANNITSDHLVLARRTVIIPGEYYKAGVSLSPRPLEGEDEERRKAIVRRWMVACKVSEYDVAILYLKQANYELESAILDYKDDERWELEHPLKGSIKGKGKLTRYDVGKRRFTGQTP